MEFKFLASYILIIIALIYSYKEKLGIEKEIFISSIRAFVQLLILGYILVYVFKLKNPLELLSVLFFMVIFATFTAQKRIKIKYKGYLTAFLSIFISSFIVLSSLLMIQVISFKPNEIIPIGGMIIGNSLNIYTLTVDRLKSEVKNTITIIEGMVALGASLKKALHKNLPESPFL
jgi:putative ABC transport system permease protein